MQLLSMAEYFSLAGGDGDRPCAREDRLGVSPIFRKRNSGSRRGSKARSRPPQKVQYFSLTALSAVRQPRQQNLEDAAVPPARSPMRSEAVDPAAPRTSPRRKALRSGSPAEKHQAQPQKVSAAAASIETLASTSSTQCNDSPVCLGSSGGYEGRHRSSAPSPPTAARSSSANLRTSERATNVQRMKLATRATATHRHFGHTPFDLA